MNNAIAQILGTALVMILLFVWLWLSANSLHKKLSRLLKEVRTAIDTQKGLCGPQETVTLPAAAGGSSLKLYEMTITRDLTESARVRVWAASAEHARSLAVSGEMEVVANFEIDDLLYGNTYLPDYDDIQIVERIRT